MIPVAYIAKKVAGKKMPGGSSSKPQSDNLAEIKKKAIVVGLGALGLGVTYIVARKIIRNIRKKRSERRFSQEAQQALLIRTALNPVGVSWLHWMDGTKEDELYNVAAQITNFRKVQQEYQNIFNRSLVVDLEKELKTEEYSRFMNIINSGGMDNNTLEDNTGNRDNNPYEINDGQIKGKVILIKNSTKIYEKFTWYPLGSVKKVEPYYFINHLATGNIKKVNVGYGRVLEFVETRIKTIEGMVKTIYVNKNDVALVPKDNFTNNYRSKYAKLIFRDDDF